MSIKLRKFVAYLLARSALKIYPESKAVKELAQYLALSSMVDGGYVKIINPKELYKGSKDAANETKT